MLTHDEAMHLIDAALRHSPADQTEIVLSFTEQGLTRLANGGIHQHMAMANGEARVRAVLGTRVGVATSNRLTAESVRELVDQAVAIARVSEPNPECAVLPTPETAEYAGLAGAVPTPILEVALDALTPERRADVAAVLVQTAQGNGVTAAGHVASALSALAVGNSHGVRAYHRWPSCGIMAIMTQPGASGYADWAGTDLSTAPAAEIAARACRKCLASQGATTVAPGAYTVILEPPAVAEMLAMLAYIGLGATAFQEGRSFMSDRVGETLVGDNISLRDDTYHPGMLTMPFDFEGTPKRVVPFFTHGVARGVVHDTATARKAGVASTGHALPAPNPAGPLPMHLVLDTGDQTMDSLIGGVERGILVTRFHYVNIVHPKETTLTGMTRDGTFLIEDGSLTHAVQNMRFTQSILAALSQVTGIERHQTSINQEGLYCLAPALRIAQFTFTS
ncbi:MAG TPA: metallopeptidase TldD-related protein [Armatimonadota bacterium]|jgi:predicted Zn-dependent protease